MGIFNENPIAEVSLEKKFRLTNLLYRDIDMHHIENPFNYEKELSLDRSGDPLYSFFDNNWAFPWFRVDEVELKSFDEQKMSSIIWKYNSQYSFGQNGFTCTWDGQRINVMSEYIIKPQYQYLYMYDIPFFHRLLDQGMKRGKVDEIFSFDNVVKEFNQLAPYLPIEHQEDLVGKDYWKSIIDIMVNGIKIAIDDRYYIDIQYSVKNCKRDSVRVMMDFEFIAKEQKPLYWYFFDRGLIKNMNFNHCEIASMHPKFKINFTLENK